VTLPPQPAVIAVEGYLNQTGGEKLRDAVRALLPGRPARVALDFSGASLVNSIGISFLLEAIEEAQAAGVKVEIQRAPEEIGDLFKLLGITARVAVL
jgi:ABC-type transporter Mla MlaB component